MLHEEVQRYVQLPWVREFAAQFEDIDDFAAYVRQLEQRDDLGEPDDGPRLPCEISQRTRFAPGDPNCWERTLLYLAVAEILAPWIERTSASLVMDRGWHTFPVEIRNGFPEIVVLDPVYGPPRNAMAATAYRARNIAPASRKHLPMWFAQVARNACLDEYGDDGEHRYEDVMGVLRNALLAGEPVEDAEYFEDLEEILEIAAQDAELWGSQGRAAHAQVERSISQSLV